MYLSFDFYHSWEVKVNSSTLVRVWPRRSSWILHRGSGGGRNYEKALEKRMKASLRFMLEFHISLSCQLGWNVNTRREVNCV